MVIYEAKTTAWSAAVNMAVDGVAPAKNLVNAAIAYLCGKTDKNAFAKKCAKNPLYARLIFFAERGATEFSPESFAATHKFLFEPRANSGEIRSDELTLVGGSCADPKLLRGSLKNLLGKLSQMPSHPQVGKADFAAQLCSYIRELIILSPFPYGNPVTRRAYIQAFCRNRGFYLNYAAAGKKEIAAADTAAFAGDDPQPLFGMLVKCLSYITDQEPSDRPRKRLGGRKKPPAPALKSPQKQLHEPPKRHDEQRTAPTRPAEKPAAIGAPSKPERTADKSENAATAAALREMRKTIDALSNQLNELTKTFSESEKDDNRK